MPAVLARWKRIGLRATRSSGWIRWCCARHEGDAGADENVTRRARSPAGACVVLASLTLAWGFNWTAMKTALAEVPPWTFRSLCLGLGSAVLFAALRAAASGWCCRPDNGPALARAAQHHVLNMLVAFGVGMILGPPRSSRLPVWASCTLSVLVLGDIAGASCSASRSAWAGSRLGGVPGQPRRGAGSLTVLSAPRSGPRHGAAESAFP